jgi:catechol 2,3-dioxygenase-like lactoylglutathione lyase family enzyme
VLGRFLEFSISTPDIQASLEFYRKLGFTEAEVGEAWPHPYAVLSDGRIHLGLHQESARTPSITFVKPDLLKHVDALEKRGVELEFRRLGNEVFNEVGWFDPSRHLIRLIEARTFSPTKRSNTETSLCGYFLEIGLPAPNPAAARAYWENFGFVAMDDEDGPLPHVSCTSDHIDLGLYDPAYLPRPALIFETEDVEATLAALAEVGIFPAAGPPARPGHAAAAVFTAPEGTRILLAPA